MNINQKQVKKFAISALAAAITLGLSACSSDNPDQGTTYQFGTVSGTVVDGYVAGATVYLDINNNGRKDAGEPYAITDKDGSFTTSKDGSVNYCAATATTLQQRHCLRSASTGSQVALRAYGGFDVLTGEPFVGTLSTTVTTVAGGAVADQMISPLTSMLMEVSIEDRAALLDSIGLTEEDLENDFLDESSFDADVLAAALSFHKVVTIFAKVLDDNYDELGTNNDFPTNSSNLIYQALAPYAETLENADSLEDAFDVAEAAIRALYAADEELTAPALVTDLDKDEAINNALAALGLIDDIIPSETDFADANALVLAVELVVQKMTEGADDVDETIALAGDSESELTALLSDNADIDFKGLVDADLSGTPDYEDYAIPEDAASFTDLAGSQLKVNYADEERNGDAYFFFNAADEDDAAGTLNTCLRYEEEVDDSDEETDGSYLDATWFAIDPKRMVVTLGDGAYNITIISKGPTEGGDLFSLSYGGETRTWESDDGIIASNNENAVTEPTDDTSCAALFNPVL